MHMKRIKRFRLAAATLILLSIFMMGPVSAYIGPYAFGSKVMNGDIDVGKTLYSFGQNPVFAYWDAGSIRGELDREDVVYLHFCADENLSTMLNDLRITKAGGFLSGSKVKQADFDIDKPLVAFPNKDSQAYLAYADLFGNEGYDLEDPVFLKYYNDKYTSSIIDCPDIMIGSNNNHIPGSFVDKKDQVAGMNAEIINYRIRFYNTNGNMNSSGSPIYDEPDAVYVDFAYGNEKEYSKNIIGFVVVNDIRLTNQNEGTGPT